MLIENFSMAPKMDDFTGIKMMCLSMDYSLTFWPQDKKESKKDKKTKSPKKKPTRPAGPPAHILFQMTLLD